MKVVFRAYKPFERDILGLLAASSGGEPDYLPSRKASAKARDFEAFEGLRAEGLVGYHRERRRSD